jgi:hypothetical protein
VIEEESSYSLTSHSGDGVGRSYGSDVPLKRLVEAIEKISFDVDLSGI